MVRDYDVIILEMPQLCIPALQFSFSAVYSNSVYINVEDDMVHGHYLSDNSAMYSCIASFSFVYSNIEETIWCMIMM